MRGTRRATGLVLDVPVIGEDEARRRVFALWASGAALHALEDGRWLLLLAAPLEVRAERAPGVPVAEDLRELRHGVQVRHDTAALARIEPARWLEFDVPVHPLRPLDAPVAPARVERVEAVADPDIRGLAKVAPPSPDVDRLRAATTGAASRRRGLGARLLMRTPVRDVIGRRHARYLERLTRSFERGDYENALRDAIGLAGTGEGGGWMSLRLPGRRTGPLRPTSRLGGGGGAVPWHSSVSDHLTALYRRAAEQLEQAGEIERAAFVHADLLKQPRDAVALLERHGRFELAARLAEGRALDPDLCVRLWWRAGDRPRAIALARARHAWAAAIDRLRDLPPEFALELRAEWLAYERARGDHRAAIEVAWPEPALREGIGADLAALRARGGVHAAASLALELAWRPGETCEALALLGGSEPARAGRGEAAAGDARAPGGATGRPPGAAERLAFLETLVELPAVDETADRRLATAGVRALLRDAAAAQVRTTRGGRTTFNRLRDRADPLLRADLAPFPAGAERQDVAVIDAAADPGAIAIADAVWLEGTLLVAAGERGLLRLTESGRVAQQWALGADHLVVADHGGALLVGARGEAVIELQRLELASGRLQRWAALSERWLPRSYDGGTLVALGPDGAEGLDTTALPPRALWTDLRGANVLAFERAAGWMTALVDLPVEGRRRERTIERWTWELPARRLLWRGFPYADELSPGPRVTADGTVVWIAGDTLHSAPRERPREAIALTGPSAIEVSGEHVALLEPARLTIGSSCVATFGGAERIDFRVHAEVATVWTPDGRVVVADLVTGEVLANLRTRP